MESNFLKYKNYSLTFFIKNKIKITLQRLNFHFHDTNWPLLLVEDNLLNIENLRLIWVIFLKTWYSRQLAWLPQCEALEWTIINVLRWFFSFFLYKTRKWGGPVRGHWTYTLFEKSTLVLHGFKNRVKILQNEIFK